MNREEAERALGIIRQVVENTREDLVAHNWGMIWMVHAFTNLAGFVAIGLLVESRSLPIVWYLVPLAVTGVVNTTAILLLTHRDQGVRSFVDWHVHGIWWTFMVFSLVAAAVIYLAQAPPALFCPMMAITSGIGFAMTGVVFYRQFLAFAALFVLVAILAPLVPGVQWTLLGVAWWVALFLPGLVMHRERAQRARRDPATEIL